LGNPESLEGIGLNWAKGGGNHTETREGKDKSREVWGKIKI